MIGLLFWVICYFGHTKIGFFFSKRNLKQHRYEIGSWIGSEHRSVLGIISRSVSMEIQGNIPHLGRLYL